MQDDLIGFVLGALDAEEQSTIERTIARDVEVRLQFETLHQAVAPLCRCLRDDCVVPAELAVRTCRMIVEVSADGAGADE